MSYVIDSNSIRVLGNYYPDRFPSVWQNLEALIAGGRLVSTREVYRELEDQAVSEHVQEWVEENKTLFVVPTSEELGHVRSIFQVRHFQQLIGNKQRLKGMPVADPFVVASAMEREWCVISEEGDNPNAAKIPNVCRHFNVECMKLEGLMAREGWLF